MRQTVARLGLRSFLVAVPLALGCAHRPVTRVVMEPMKIEAKAGPGGPRVEAYDAGSLFEQGSAALRAGRHAEAAALFERLLREFPDSRQRVPSLYNAGLAYESLKRYDEAAARYQHIVDEKPAGKDGLDALFRLGSCLAELKRWPESLQVFDKVLGRPDLDPSDRVEALARKGLAQTEMNDLGPAERTFQDVLARFAAQKERERLGTDFFLGLARFYLGRIQHRIFQGMPLRLPQRQLEEDLEAKAKVFLLAQARYIETIRVQDPVWASAAGFQIGALYKEMFDTLLNSPLPPELDSADKREVYFDVLKEKLRGLLERAKRIHEKNIHMAERVGIDNDWVRRSGDQLAELEQLLAAIPKKDAQAGDGMKN